MRKQTKLVAVASAAALLAIGASMTSFAAGWTEEDGTWVYLNKDGDRIYNEWKKSGNDYYYLNDDGEMAVDVVIEHTDGKKYYVDSTGKKVVNTWVELDNEDDVTVDDKEVSTLWMYFDKKGQATTGYGKKISGKYYNFDESGYMMSGWVEKDEKTLYYCGDENEGWAYTGWQNLEADDNLANVPYDESKWFYFGSNGKATKGVTKYIDGKYYTFDTDGSLIDTWYDVATPPTSVGVEAYASVNGTTGLGWVEAKGRSDTSKTFWYYLTNVRVGGEVAARGVPFGYATTPKDDVYVAKSIKSKTYLFNTYGEMQTGIVTLTADNYIADIEGGKKLDLGTYYFNENDGSVEGQMMTGKITIEEDAENFYYCFDKNGIAFAKAIKNGVLYGKDGRRIQAEDGNKYEIYDVTETIKYYDKTVDKKPVEIPAGSQLLVNASGKVRTTTGNVTIEDVQYKVTFDIAKNTYTVVAQ